jgi:hypothetical protein
MQIVIDQQDKIKYYPDAVRRRSTVYGKKAYFNNSEAQRQRSPATACCAQRVLSGIR